MKKLEIKNFKRNPLSEVVKDFVLPKRIERDGLRLYVTPEGKEYPSVTTVLGSQPKPELEAWKRSIGEEEAERVSKRATHKGTIIHEMCEYYLENKLEERQEQYNFINYMGFNPLKKILDERVDNVVDTELMLYSDRLESAGTIDLIAEFDGKLSIIDFKTSNDIKYESQIKDYFMQSSAYAYMMNEHFGTQIEDVVILMTVEGGDSLIFQKKARDFIVDYLKLRIKFKEERKS